MWFYVGSDTLSTGDEAQRINSFGGGRAGADAMIVILVIIGAVVSLKSAPPDELLNAIRVVAAGDAVVAPRVTRRLLDRFADRLVVRESTAAGPPDLTEREREVLLLVAQGLSNLEISGRLPVAEATVKTHIGRILNKLGLRDRVQAVVFAYETGLVQPGGR